MAQANSKHMTMHLSQIHILKPMAYLRSKFRETFHITTEKMVQVKMKNTSFKKTVLISQLVNIAKLFQIVSLPILFHFTGILLLRWNPPIHYIL